MINTLPKLKFLDCKRITDTERINAHQYILRENDGFSLDDRIIDSARDFFQKFRKKNGDEDSIYSPLPSTEPAVAGEHKGN